jgi:hypothetical protein
VDFGDGDAQGWFERGDLRFNADDMLRFYGGGILEVQCGRRMRCQARFSEDYAHADVRISPWLPGRTLMNLPRAYEVAFLSRLARKGVAVLHAVGLVLDGVGGVLLPASTGSGKSTLAAAHRASDVLSDERVALALGPDGAPWIYGTPLRAEGRRVQAAGAPLAALAFLGAHGQGWRSTPLRRGDTFRRLVFHMQSPLWDRVGLERTVDLAHTTSQALSAVELCFEPGPDLPSRLREVLC